MKKSQLLVHQMNKVLKIHVILIMYLIRIIFFREQKCAIEYNDNCLLQALLISFKERMGDSMFQTWCHPKAE